MKAIIVIWLICILFSLASCSKPPGSVEPVAPVEPIAPVEPVEPAEQEEANNEAPMRGDLPASEIEPTVWYGDKAGFAEQYDMADWAWGIMDWGLDAVRDTIVAAAYAAPETFEDLTLAAGSPGVFPVEYKGVKKGTEEFHWPLYSPTFAVVTGPSWGIAGGLLPEVASDFVLLPAANKEGLLSMTFPSVPDNQDWDYYTEYYNHGRPPASDEDISFMEAKRNGRKVAHSEQIAMVSDGGRVSLFQYETTVTGMVSIAYFNNEKCVERVFVTNAHDGIAWWASELPPETFPYLSLAMLYQSDAGLVIGFSRFGPEWDDRYILAEKDGYFVDFNYGYWEYDVWRNPQEYVQNTHGLINSETWPELDPAELVGKWEGALEFRDDSGELIGGEVYDYTFDADGTGTLTIRRHLSPIEYSVEGNMLITKKWGTTINNKEYQSEDYYLAKIEKDRLYLCFLYEYEPFCLIMTRK